MNYFVKIHLQKYTVIIFKYIVSSELFVFFPQSLTHSNLFDLNLDPATQQSSSIGPTRGGAMGGGATAPLKVLKKRNMKKYRVFSIFMQQSY